MPTFPFATLLKYEADSGANPGAQSGGQTPEDQKTGHPDTVSKADYDKVLSANNWAQSQVKTLNLTVKELNEQLAELKSAGKKGGKSDVDVEALLAKNAELEKALNSERESAKYRRIEEKVRRDIGEKLAPNTWDYYWQAQKDKFQLVEVDGKESVQYAPAPWMSMEEVLEAIPAAMKASTKAAGAGTPEKSGGNYANGQLSASQYEKLSKQQKQEYLAKNPDLWRAVFEGNTE